MPIYLGTWLIGAVLTGIASVVLMFAVAVPVFGVDIYPRMLPAAIVTLLLGAACLLAALGLAVASLVRNADQAGPVAQLTFLPLSFISGIWYPLDGAPDWVIDDRAHLPALPPGRGVRRVLRAADHRRRLGARHTSR